MNLQSVVPQSDLALVERPAPSESAPTADSSGAALAADNPGPSAEFNRSLIEALPALRRYAQRLTGNADRASDLVQETAARAVEKHVQFRDVGRSFTSWLCTIMKNLFFDAGRRGRKWPTCSFEETAHASLRSIAPAQVDRVLLDEMFAAIAELPSAQQQVLGLVVFDGLSYEQVSERTGFALGTVRSRLFRARVALARRLNLADIASPQQRLKLLLTTGGDDVELAKTLGVGARGEGDTGPGPHVAPRRQRRAWTAEQEARLDELLAEGLTGPEIARRMGRTQGSIDGHLHVRGIKLREREIA